MCFSNLGLLQLCNEKFVLVSLCTCVNVFLRNKPKSEIPGSQVIYILSFIYTATFPPKIVSVCNPSHSVREFWFPQILTHTFQCDMCMWDWMPRTSEVTKPKHAYPTFPDAQKWDPDQINELFTEVKKLQWRNQATIHPHN